MSRASAITKSVFAGAALSIPTGASVLGVALLGMSFAVAAFVLFGAPFAYLFTFVLPPNTFYQLFPEDGGAAFATLSLVGSFLQLLIIYSFGFYFLWFSRNAH